jgi:flavin reductase (DIM6/NTAB) family NADH-FMN oxidoreductase RutF
MKQITDMLTVDPKTISVAKMHAYLLGSVTPRPIAFASTIDKDGNVNLSPFSFFNCFGMNPPLLIFSPARRVRDNTTKHTYENVLEVPEVVINVVNYSMVQQASLASTEYPKGINEFLKSGFTEVRSERVRPPRVAESPVAWECKVRDVVKTGDQGGAGNLVICEILLMHIREDLLDAEGKIDQQKIDTVARLGGDWYCRVHGDALFKVPKPIDRTGIGIDQIPHNIRWSKILTGNDLGMLANVEQLPADDKVDAMRENEDVAMAIRKGEEALHLLAQSYLKAGKVNEAWEILLQKNRS